MGKEHMYRCVKKIDFNDLPKVTVLRCSGCWACKDVLIWVVSGSEPVRVIRRRLQCIPLLWVGIFRAGHLGYDL